MIIDSDKIINDELGFNILSENINTISVYNLQQAKIVLKEENIDMIILDSNLSDGSGFDFCKDIKKILNIPIIFFSIKFSESDILKGLEIGADDYFDKLLKYPFGINVLREKINTLFSIYDKFKNE